MCVLEFVLATQMRMSFGKRKKCRFLSFGGAYCNMMNGLRWPFGPVRGDVPRPSHAHSVQFPRSA